MVRNIGRYFQTGTSRDIKRFGGDPLEVNRFQGARTGQIPTTVQLIFLKDLKIMKFWQQY